eukprot:CAMPEP_0181204410 /NCGR_PEP_ID=MMETSP1096-20121128/19922_1 /TAXON_ID=156174 ORGANISM="Chrysochromulina ericina, Strain CCMP281" /NCGR_SAMPLE_ID=MMETSP1096 /ASSEMBLY_ACC=CAM_ASM_000453 /LENGTH=294 /DNA_ID=CAMNT_0023295111 /DNA_START=400 /DNA_END=1282 /DNA_ORIENTATION=-
MAAAPKLAGVSNALWRHLTPGLDLTSTWQTKPRRDDGMMTAYASMEPNSDFIFLADMSAIRGTVAQSRDLIAVASHMRATGKSSRSPPKWVRNHVPNLDHANHGYSEDHCRKERQCEAEANGGLRFEEEALQRSGAAEEGRGGERDEMRVRERHDIILEGIEAPEALADGAGVLHQVLVRRDGEFPLPLQPVEQAHCPHKALVHRALPHFVRVDSIDPIAYLFALYQLVLLAEIFPQIGAVVRIVHAAVATDIHQVEQPPEPHRIGRVLMQGDSRGVAAGDDQTRRARHEKVLL